jgi:hypothetical protein
MLVLYGCVTWSLTLREESRLWDLQNRVLSRMYRPKGTRRQWRRENYILRSLMICTPHPVLFG